MSQQQAANHCSRRAANRASECDGLRRHTAARERGSPAPSGKSNGVVRLDIRAERERQSGHERVAAAVGVLARAGDDGGGVRATGLHPTPERARRGHDEIGLRVEVARVVALRLVFATADERVESDPTAAENVEIPGRGRQDGCAAREPKCLDIARDDVLR